MSDASAGGTGIRGKPAGRNDGRKFAAGADGGGGTSGFMIDEIDIGFDARPLSNDRGSDEDFVGGGGGGGGAG